MSRVTTATLQEMKAKGVKSTLLTAYDYPTARLLDEAGIDILLVGDSLGNVVLGYENTLPVTMEESLHHTSAVARGAERAMVVGDMPFLSYQTTVADAVWNAGRYLKEAGAHAVKLEGGRERADAVRAMVETGIPVMGHLGLTPQSVHQFGGFRVQGKSEDAARRLIEDAVILEEAGIFSLLLECVPAELAEEVTTDLCIPTLSCGAGPHCSGQVMVLHDMLGFSGGKVPKFVKQYANLHDVIIEALTTFKKEVQEGVFPGPEHCYK
ncbi:MAG TPA: 3-methyl-2-oxobutanoate hydroxymethyltransferase [Syntrophaceticus sp.]|jgi:3-methyl-2-oxobutanoate hydroxymethyltransferase|uniref:3-methyl-2-oxobutanoate hydroxymethyltransferase n=1 Tax=Syntrophaceticus schinkii TaxID=499207 RepID=A0A0B7MGB1_9FIRM|nr:3-methyl-2-oxobutanoate hydroxymethyltransferase [Syntrophaceticus schinkii]CEO89120.1 3-methyl-2-oxobutanoate hydroxymethyltransferase [Syntrophaceticus schinkii]HHY30743.1 3-methyl-2-oxobutanoate hydroxymethyltransferase [Syntrophaceticus sp.]